MAVSTKASINRQVDLRALAQFAEKLEKITDELREQITAPEPRKEPPTFTSTQVAAMCGIDRNRFNYLASRDPNTLPAGEGAGNRRTRTYTLVEAREWVRQVADFPKTPLDTKGIGAAKVLLSANFKGGSTKTTSAMTLAQGLTLRGRKVLIIDLDPQASITELCGLLAEHDVTEEDCVNNYIYDPDNNPLENIVRTTYWDGIDVIAAHASLFSAEFKIPSMATENPGFPFWKLLSNGIEPLRTKYDYIILDSAPSLSYLTINALMAADALIMPLVPESLDFMSSVTFWTLFSDLSEQFLGRGETKLYDFVSVLLSKVDYSPSAGASVVRSWAQRAYTDWMHTIEIPYSTVASSAGLALATVFDMSKGDADGRSLARARDPMVAYCQWVDEQFTGHWRNTQ